MITRVRCIWCGEESENMKPWEPQRVLYYRVTVWPVRTTQTQPHEGGQKGKGPAVKGPLGTKRSHE